MERVTIASYGPVQSCLVHIGSELEPLLLDLAAGGQRVLVVTDERVARLHGHRLPDHFSPRLILPALGEGLKTEGWLRWVLAWLGRVGAARQDMVVAMGGGALTDLVGFAAAVFKRGVELVHVPTTVVGQIDAAIGGKCGINWLGSKNMVGTFYFPKHVIAATRLLYTLPRRQVTAAMGEVCKYQLLWLQGDWAKFRLLSPRLPATVMKCSRFKCAVVDDDPYDQDGRHVLNLGHTLAHCLEAVSPRMLHGEAVLWGLEYALAMAVVCGRLEQRLYRSVAAKLRCLPRPPLPAVTFSTLWHHMRRDKKAAAGQVVMVMPDAAGNVAPVKCGRKELEYCWHALVHKTLF